MKNLFLSSCSFLVLLSLSSASFGSGDASPWEEMVFPASEVKGFKVLSDRSDVQVFESDSAEEVRVQFQKKCPNDNVKIELTREGVYAESINPPKGGCSVNYRAFLPRDAYVSIEAGRANVDVSNMGGLEVTAGTLNLKARNIQGPVTLQYSSGEAEVQYKSVPPSPMMATVDSSSGKTTFLLPPDSTVNYDAARPNLVQSDFVHSLRSNFFIRFNSSRGALILKKSEI